MFGPFDWYAWAPQFENLALLVGCLLLLAL
jgi:hypothetical protein